MEKKKKKITRCVLDSCERVNLISEQQNSYYDDIN